MSSRVVKAHSAEPQVLSWRPFVLMILASTGVMFGLIYLNTYAVEHVFFSKAAFTWRS